MCCKLFAACIRACMSNLSQSFAFATITSDMKVDLSADDVTLLNDLVARKGSAKIMIAVGGWAFSQEGDDKALFTTMISTSANRATFIASVKSFISTYKLDDLDIDMGSYMFL